MMDKNVWRDIKKNYEHLSTKDLVLLLPVLRVFKEDEEHFKIVQGILKERKPPN